MEFVICIPSYKRATTCNEKTLRMLHDNKVQSTKIYVYVANKEEYEEYKKILNPKYYNKLVIGKVGIVPQRKFIMEQYKEGQHIVYFDDDVESIDLSLSMFKGKSLSYFIKYAFNACKKEKSYIWGVYPVYNPFFRKPKKEMSTELVYIVGCFYGIINRPKLKDIEITLTKENGNKEDVEMSIKYFITDGIVLRFNKVGFITKYYGKSGGLGTFESRLKPMLEASKKLKKAYPEYGDIYTKKTGMTEFRLKKIKSKYDVVKQKTKKNTKKNTKKTRKKN